MPIKDRNGNIYKIQGPNPVMKEQEFWDKSKLKFINFVHQEETVSDEGRIVIQDVVNKNEPVPKKEIENILVLKPEPIIETQPVIEEIVIQPEPVIAPKPTMVEKKPEPENQPDFYDQDQLNKINKIKIQVNCLPVFDREVKDEVYGYTYTVKSYGDKFTFEAVMIEEDDLFCRFWTNKKIPSSSIVYPKNQSRRWWQVQELENFENGYLIMAVLTQANPDFTD